jgi:hypothetical protein
MESVPGDILQQFNTVLEQKAVLSSLRDDYRKWLRYYLDFRVKETSYGQVYNVGLLT